MSSIAPGIYTRTIDQSAFEPDPGIRTLVSLHTIFSPRGPDNVIQTFGVNSKDKILKYYGMPNFNKYGQSYHTACQWAGEGYETAICRLLPSDATYANILFKYRKTKETLTEVKTATSYNGTDAVAFIEVKSLENVSVGQKIAVTGWYKSDEVTKVMTAAVYTNTALKEFEVVSLDGLEANMKIFIGDNEVTIKDVIPADATNGTNNKITIKESTITATVAKDTSIVKKVEEEKLFTIREVIDEGMPKLENGFSANGPFKIKTKEELRLNIEVDAPIIKRTKSVVTDFLPNANEVTKFKTEVEKPVDNLSEEVIEIPFLAIYPVGRGVDYNKLSLQIMRDSEASDQYKEFAVYTMRVFDRQSENGVDTLIGGEEFQFSFYPDAQDVNGRFLFFKDIIEEYSKYIQFIFSDYKFKQILCDLYDLDIDTASDAEIYSKDFLQNNIKFADNTQNRFNGGTDGSLWTKEGAINWGSKEEIESGALTNATNLMIAFYNGSLDKKLLDRKWVRCKYIWDNGYPVSVKNAMAELTKTGRPDIRFIADTGFATKEEEEIAFRKNVFTLDHCNTSIYPNNGIAIDKFTNKKINVTSTYNVCKLFAKVKNGLGPHYAVAGKNANGILDEMVKIAYSPSTLEYKEQFTKHQLNTIIQDPLGIFIYENLTAQKSLSAKQETHIVDTLQVIDVELSDFCEKYLFTLRITDENLKTVESEISQFLSKWVNNKACEFITVKVSATPQQRANRSATANISLKFAGILKIMYLNFTVLGEGSARA